MVKEGLKAASNKKISKALIFAAQGTIDLKLYEQNRLKCIYPSQEEQQKINRIIREIAGGTINENQWTILRDIIASIYKANPFDGIILGCTELPLVHQAFLLSCHEEGRILPVIDTVETLAARLVELAL
jgi:aspartate/glutamate racemase